MEENNNRENGIQLQDGRIIQGYPKQDDIVGETAETTMLDTTGEYFSIRHKPQPHQPTDEEEDALVKIFTDNAFLILANRERILNDSRMLLAQVPARNGLAYSGAFQVATLGVYIEWWLNTPYSILFDENDTMSLIWFVSGSPLSGCNLCANVTEDGHTETVRVPFFKQLWPNFIDILADYHEPKKLYQAYDLPTVIDILKRDTTAEEYEKSLETFRNQAHIRLLKAELIAWKNRHKETEEERADYQRKWHSALIHSRIDDVKAFYQAYTQKAETIRKRTDELTEENHNLKERLRKAELTNKQYQQLLRRNKKEMENIGFNLSCFKDKELATLFPEMATTYCNVTRIKFTEDNIMDEITKLYKQ